MVSVPILLADQVIGVVWLEDQHQPETLSEEEITFARTIASLLALRFAVVESRAYDDQPITPSTPMHAREQLRLPDQNFTIPQEMRESRLAGDRTALFEQRLETHGRELGAQVYVDTVVLVLKLTKPYLWLNKPKVRSAV